MILDKERKGKAKDRMAFNATSWAIFAHNNILSRVDALEKPPKKRRRLIEVKSSTNIEDAPAWWSGKSSSPYVLAGVRGVSGHRHNRFDVYRTHSVFGRAEALL